MKSKSKGEPQKNQLKNSNQNRDKNQPNANPENVFALPNLEEISEISIRNSQSPNQNQNQKNKNFGNIDQRLLFNPEVKNKSVFSNNQQSSNQKTLFKNKMSNNNPNLRANVSHPKADFDLRRARFKREGNNKSKNKSSGQFAPKSEINNFLEDFDATEVQSFSKNPQKPSEINTSGIQDQNSFFFTNKMDQDNMLKSFSFRGSGVSNSKELTSQSFLKKKKKEGNFTEVSNQRLETSLLKNDTSINIGLPPIPKPGKVFLPGNSSFKKLPPFQMDNSFNIPRNNFPAGSNPDFLSNLDKSFQKVNDSGFHEILEIPENKGSKKMNLGSELENLNNSFKDYQNPNASFNYNEKTMNKLTGMNNSFDLSIHKPRAFGHGLNDTLNQSGQFNLRNLSKTNLDNSYNYYLGAPNENFLSTIPNAKENETSMIKPGNEHNTSFDFMPENILSMLEKKPEKSKTLEIKKENRAKAAILKEKFTEAQSIKGGVESGKFFLDPEEANKKEKICGKIQRVQIEEPKKEDVKEEAGGNIQVSDIMNYIINNYSAECINNVVNAKCAKYIKKKPDIFEMINSVILKNKKWKRILDLVQKELSKKEGTSDSDNLKSTFSITTEQKKDDQKIVNKININFNTEVKYQGMPWKLAKYLRKKKKKRYQRRKTRKTREMEDSIKARKFLKKQLGYSEKYSSSNGSDSSEQIINVKRVKQSDSKSDGKMMTSFISEHKESVQDSTLYNKSSNPIEIEEQVITVVKNKKMVKKSEKEGLLNKREFKRKRGRPKGSKNSKTSSIKSRNKDLVKRRRGRPSRKRKVSLKERMRKLILNDGESFGMNSDLDSVMGTRSRRSRRKKSDLNQENDFSGMRGNTRIVFDILKVTFTEMRIESKSQADFLNNESEEAKVLRVILKKKFEIKETMKVEKLKMKKEKKRNEEINKFVVKRCMKFLMKKNRDKSMNKTDENDSENFSQNLKKGMRNSALLEGGLPIPHMQVLPSQTSIFKKDPIPFQLQEKMKSLSNISLEDETKKQKKEIINSQSDFPEFKELNDEVLPSLKDRSFLQGEFGPNSKEPQISGDLVFNAESQKMFSLLNKVQETIDNPQEGEGRENTKMLAHSKLLSEHQFYKKYFNHSAQESGTPLAKYYLPNTKLANNANSENKGNKSAQSYKTINIKYIRLILHSKYFSHSINDFLLNTFEFEYRETRIQKLRLLAKSIKNPKYIKSVKLPWTMHEIMEAKNTFLNLISNTEKELNNEKKTKMIKKSKKKKKKDIVSPVSGTERRNTRSRIRSRKLSPNLKDENFQACFANNNQSNKFLGN